MPADVSTQADPQPWTDSAIRAFFAGLIKMVDETPTSQQNQEVNKAMLREAERILLASDHTKEKSIESRRFWHTWCPWTGQTWTEYLGDYLSSFLFVV